MSTILTPEGIITMRAPTEAEAIAFEDKRRAARRPRAEGEQVTGGAYDNGIEELLACVVSPAKDVLNVDDGWLALYPGVADRMAEEFRRLGGYHLQLALDAEAVSETHRANYGRRALGYSYGDVKLTARRMTWAEYNAFQANRTPENFWVLLAAQGRLCMLSHQDKEQEALLAGRPYLAMELGAALLNAAMGVAESALGKSASASTSKTAISTSPPATSSAPDTASAGASS